MIYFETISNKHLSDLNPVQFGYEDCEKSHHFGPALRTYWLLHFVVSGKGEFTIRGKKYAVNPGHIFVIPPFVETYYEADAKDPWEYIWVGFTMAEHIPVTFDDVIYLPEAGRIFEDMKRCSQRGNGKTAYLCAKIWQLLSKVQEREEVPVDYVDEALNLIHSEYMSNITVQDIANRLNLERTYFAGLFKKRMGVSPKQYLINYRMQQAKTLLCDHGYSVSLTALSVGYNDVYIFSKMFKRHFGIAPSACKKDE